MSGLRIVSSDGRNHALRVISPSGTVNLGGTTTGDPNIAAQISVGGSLKINGTSPGPRQGLTVSAGFRSYPVPTVAGEA